MALEIEKKFLVKDDTWRAHAAGIVYRQGYISVSEEHTVRVRMAGKRGFLTIKGGSVGGGRQEFEYQIPTADADEMLTTLCTKPLVEKKRYNIAFAGFTWEVDEFFGENDGLIIAEIELEYIDQPFPKPDWVGAEVTGDSRYYNASLATYPYRAWKKQ